MVVAMTAETFSENQVLRGKVKCPECGAIMASGGMTRYTLKDGSSVPSAARSWPPVA
jgi:ribosomal protein S27AE